MAEFKKNTEDWYHVRLKRYFDYHYKHHENEVEWFINPDINKWKFYIPSLNRVVFMVCEKDGNIITLERNSKEWEHAVPLDRKYSNLNPR